jgi:peptide/nickel transport system substrate-binding protein
LRHPWTGGSIQDKSTDARPSICHVPRTRCGLYKQAAEYIAKNYYGPFYFSLNPTNVSVKGVGGPGLTSPLPAVVVAPAIPWEDIWYNPSGT